MKGACDLARRALEDLDRDEVSSEAWVQIYGRRLAEELVCSAGLLGTSRRNMEALLHTIAVATGEMREVRSAVSTFQRNANWAGAGPKGKATQKRWLAACRLATRCSTASMKFFAQVAGALASAPSSLLEPTRKDAAAVSAQEEASDRLASLVQQVTAAGDTPLTRRFADDINRVRAKMRGKELKQEPSDDEEVPS